MAHFPGGKSQQGLPIGPVASVFVSRWDGAVASKVTAESKNKLGIAIAQRTYKAGIDIDAFAAQLWGEAARSFVKSWNDLMSVIASKIKTIKPEK